MADDEEEEEEEEEEQKGPKKLPLRKKRGKCQGGIVKEGETFKIPFPCKMSGTSRPTHLFQCMLQDRPPPMPQPPQATAPARDANDPYPPQGGTLTQTCGVKAQFVGEIIIKKEIPPRPQPCQEDIKANDCPPAPSPLPEKKPASSPCHDPCIHASKTSTPPCGPYCFPLRQDIGEDCRRMLYQRGPDSSRMHPCCCGSEPLEYCYCDDFAYPRRTNLHAGEEERYETVRTREEVCLDPKDPCCCYLGEILK